MASFKTPTSSIPGSVPGCGRFDDGWPEQTETIEENFIRPLTSSPAGHHFLLVARMIMAGYEFMGDPKFGLPIHPFRNVYFTGISRQAGAQDVQEPRNSLIRLTSSPVGADALRFGTMRSAPLGQDIYSMNRTSSWAAFCNKLWKRLPFPSMRAARCG